MMKQCFLKVGLPSQLVILAIWHSFFLNVLAIFDDNYCSTAAKHSTRKEQNKDFRLYFTSENFRIRLISISSNFKITDSNTK